MCSGHFKQRSDAWLYSSPSYTRAHLQAPHRYPVKLARPSGLREHWLPATFLSYHSPACTGILLFAARAWHKRQAQGRTEARQLRTRQQAPSNQRRREAKSSPRMLANARLSPPLAMALSSLFSLTLAPMCIILSNLSCGQNGLHQC